jgi:hypothetical protein
VIPGDDRGRPLTTDGPNSVTTTASTIAYVGQVSREIGWESCWAAIQDAGEIIARVSGMAQWQHPRYAELEKRRQPDHQPCGSRCDSCSCCIHAQAWRSRGGRPYLGVAAEAVLAGQVS